MADNTMGQRIAERRRLLGLSQEALGEKLGVSRQAISKWESDGAVPEVDKLIAMSKLFRISVGWLLGTEEACPGDRENKQEKDIPQHPGRKFLWPGICLALCAAVLGLWFGQSRLRSRLDNSEAMIGALQAENRQLAGELHALYMELQSQEEKEVDDSVLLSDYSWEVLSMNGSDHGRVFFTLIPKSWAEGDTATLVARYHGAVAGAEECTWDGFAFTGRLILPPENGYEYYFTLTHSGINAMGEYVSTQEHQRLYAEGAENLARQLQVGCALGVESYGLEMKNGVLTLSDASVSAAMPDCLAGVSDSRVSWTAMDLVLYKNGQEVDRVSPPGLLTEGDKSTAFHATIEQAELHFGGMEDGDALELWLEVSLSNGMTGRAFGEGWMLEGGEIIKLEVVGPD